MNTIDELIEVLQGVKAGRKWGYIGVPGVPQKYPDQSIEELKKMFPHWQLCLMPETITCNGIEIPAPLRVAMKVGCCYYVPCPTAKEYFTYYFWSGSVINRAHLDRDIVYTTPEAAAAHGKAMCGVRE